jgi:hypothetical protein
MGKFHIKNLKYSYAIIWKLNLHKNEINNNEKNVLIKENPFRKFLGIQSGDIIDLAWSDVSNF